MSSSIYLIIIEYKNTYFNGMSIMNCYTKYAKDYVYFCTHKKIYLNKYEYKNMEKCFNEFINYITFNQIYNGDELTHFNIFEIMDNIYKYTEYNIDDFYDEDDIVSIRYIDQ